MAIGAVSSALKAARAGIKKKKEDELQAGYEKYKATPEAEREDNPTYELNLEGERLAAADKEKADAAANLKTRQGIASGFRNLSNQGSLTEDKFNEGKKRALAAGVTEDQFSSFIDRENIKKQEPTSSNAFEAAQNVMFQREYGTGLGTLKAMQDPNYELGSGSALNRPARAIGPESGKYRRASRRLRRQGYGDAAEKMALQGEMVRLGEPSIMTPALRAQSMLQRMTAGDEARKQDQIMAGMTGDKGAAGLGGKGDALKGARKKKSIEEPLAVPKDSKKKNKKKTNPSFRTMEFRDSNKNGVDDRNEVENDGLDTIRPWKPYAKNYYQQLL